MLSLEFDQKEGELQSKTALEALGAKGAVQEMLAAQMLSVHQLQQRLAAMAMAMSQRAMNINTTQIQL